MTKESSKPSIKNGEMVTWASSGRGSRLMKKGKVVRYLDSGQNARSFIPKDTPVSKIMTRNYESTHRRYLVEVNDKHMGVIYYTPRAATIEKKASRAAKKTAKATKKAAKKTA